MIRKTSKNLKEKLLKEDEERFADVPDPDGHFEDWFDSAPTKEEIENHKHYQAGSVIWLGDEGTMIKMHKSQLEAIHGNMFDDEKVAAFAREVRDNGPIYTWAPIADVYVVSFNDVKESIESGSGNLSTGDSDLDEYLESPKYYLGTYYEEALEMSEIGPSEFTKNFIEDNTDPDEGEYDLTEEYQEELDEIRKTYNHMIQKKEQIEIAKSKNSGDIGDYRAQIRDGNHRTFGAIKAGENWIWVNAAGGYSNMEAIKGDLQ